jgi:hypothetical protein
VRTIFFEIYERIRDMLLWCFCTEKCPKTRLKIFEIKKSCFCIEVLFSSVPNSPCYQTPKKKEKRAQFWAFLGEGSPKKKPKNIQI